MGFEGKVKGRRKAPYPNSILDRKALTEALEETGISVKRIHMDEFYKALHKQRYPPLPQFVENYYANDGKDTFRPSRPQSQSQQQESNKGEPALDVVHNEQSTPTLANKIKKRKTKNKLSLPKALLDYIATTSDFVNTTSRVKEQFTSADQSTTKLIVELYDGFVVESVLMRYLQKGAGRASLCVSSQCGCAMGCTFCATGTMGLSGNLTSGEILEQLVHADRLLVEESSARIEESKDDEENNRAIGNRNASGKKKEKKLESVRNVVFMGMGEPLDNYTNVIEACRTMIDRSRWNLAHGRVTVSTVGLISQIRRLTKELPEVSLALSLHAPNQKDREAIVPTASRYPIEGLIDALDNHMMAYLNQKRERENKTKLVIAEDGGAFEEQNNLKTYTAEERMKESSRRRAMIEYVMLEGESSSFKCAHELGKLCENRHLVVNLIPYNATDVKDKLQCPSDKHMLEFRNIVQSYGAFVTIRRTMGADIASACGQLVQKKNKEQDEKEAAKLAQIKHEATTVDIEDVVVGKKNEVRANNSMNERVVGNSANETQATPQVGQASVRQNKSWSLLLSWTESLSNDELDGWSKILSIASTVSAVCFLTSSALYLRRRK
mmetsp:Transcript_18068/g.41461  ORF Transcript_18068/g.41461 Transcript_18068/m.41461 type:complete len:610 (+) Transcript_18068:231-2060(+)